MRNRFRSLQKRRLAFPSLFYRILTVQSYFVEIYHSIRIMKDSSHQHVCTVLLGFASMFRHIADDMASFLVESLVHSAHLRDPYSIVNHAGYYGQAVKETSTCITTLLAPLTLNYLKAKSILVIGSILFAFYIACFFYINNYLYFLANAILGIAFALIYIAFSVYQIQFSTKETLARNSARISAIANFSLIIGGCLYIYVTNAHNITSDEVNGQTNYRYYSENETRMLCGFLLAACLINLALNCFLPSREIDDSIACKSINHDHICLTEQMTTAFSTLIDPHVLMFIPRFASHGLFLSFMMNVYPTAMQFSTSIAMEYPMLTAYFAFSKCAGTTLCGLVIAPLNRVFHDFGLRPVFYTTVILQLAIYSISVLTVPNLSTVQPTSEPSFLEQRLMWVCLIAFLMGLADSCSSASNSDNSRSSIASLFSGEGIAASIVFSCSSMLTMRAHAVILISTTLLSAVAFHLVVKRMETEKEGNYSETELVDD